jgi:glycosyltransferase involved in cell wall biosynthesis
MNVDINFYYLNKNIFFNNNKTFVIIILILIIYLSEILLKNEILKYIEILPKISLENNDFPNLKKIFSSRQLYINDADLTNEYIRFIKPINENEEKKYKKKGKEKNIKIDEHFFKKRKDQYDFKKFGKICSEEKLIDSKIIINNNEPLISVILPTFNKESTFMKSIRSIQNQSLKNIEIIIVDDCSTDNTKQYYKNLLESDSRIRIFNHLKNLGIWRSRIDGFLYSRAKYTIQFDPGDIYEDNYVLEDLYGIISKYNIDSIKMPCRFIYDYNNLDNNKFAVIIKDSFTKVAYQPDIENYNYYYFDGNGWIWNRLTRKNIFSKCLYLLSARVLNIYKNFWEDQWLNKLINRISYSYLVIKRYGYLYFKDGNGAGDFKYKTKAQRDNMIHEFIYFLYFDYEYLPKEDDKQSIINLLHKYNETENDVNLNWFKTKFYILDALLNILIKDPYIKIEDKFFINQLLFESKKKQEKIKNITDSLMD